MPSTSRSRGSGRGPDGSSRPQVIVPMSERQQLALVMQISSQDVPPAAPTPAEERKRTRQQRNERGETPLHVAAIRGDHDQVRKLLEQQLDPDVPDFAGWTPLHEACSYGWYQVVVVLVNGGANVNAKGLDDDTPLHDATTSGNLKMVKFLIEHGADPFVKNTKGKMPSDYAAPHIYEYLQSLKETVVVSSNEVSSTQDEIVGSKRQYAEDNHEAEAADEEGSKRKKKKENEDKEPMGRPLLVGQRGPGRKPPGPASKTGGSQLGKSGGQNAKGSGSGKGNAQSQGKGGSGGKANAQSSHQSKSSGSKGSGSQGGKQDRKSPVASPKPNMGKDSEGDSEEQKSQESSGPKVPPLKIVIPGGGSSSRSEQEEGTRGSGKGRGNMSTLPYVIPCTSNDTGQTSDSSDGNSDDKRLSEGGKAGQRVLRSHRTNDGDKDKDKEKTSPQSGSDSRNAQNQLNSNKSPPPSGSGQDDHGVSTSGSGSRHDSDLHPRKRKIKSSKESHSRDQKNEPIQETSTLSHNVTHSNPYQMYIHIRKQIDRRQRSLFPVKPKPPKDFNKYLMNRCTYTLQGNVNPEPQVDIPHTMPPQMVNEFLTQEKERHRLRIQHLVEKEKLVLAVEQEILRVHGRAERAVANQALPFSVCTILRDMEVYNVLAPEQEEKRNAQRSRCNGRQINSWLQEVDDKWEKIKEGMLRRQHTEAQTLHAVQIMGWEWKLKELGLCDYKTTPKIDPTHVPQIHVSNFDLPA